MVPQTHLAERAEMTPGGVSRVEAHGRCTPATARKLALALDVSIADLMEDEPVRVPA